MTLIGYQFENMKINPEDDAMLYYTIMGNIFYRQLNSTNSGLFTAFTKSGNYITVQPSTHVVAGRLVRVTTPETFNVPSGSTLVFKINLHEDNIASGNINDDTYKVENRQLKLEVVASSVSKQQFTEFKNSFTENPDNPLITVPIYNPDFQYDPEIPTGYSDALTIDLQNNKNTILNAVDTKNNQLKTELTSTVNSRLENITNSTNTLTSNLTQLINTKLSDAESKNNKLKTDLTQLVNSKSNDIDSKNTQLKTDITNSVNSQIATAKEQIKGDTTTLAKQTAKDEVAKSAKATVDATIAKAWEEYKKAQKDTPAINTDNFTFKNASGEKLTLSATSRRQGGYSFSGPIYIKEKTSTEINQEGLVLKETNSKYFRMVESLNININKLSNGLWSITINGSLGQSSAPKTVTVNGLPNEVKGQINCIALSYNGDMLKLYSPSSASDEIKIEIPAVKSYTGIRSNQIIIPIHPNMTENLGIDNSDEASSGTSEFL